MRARGLILENVDGTQPEGPTVRFVLRSVPHNLSMGTSIRNGGFNSSPHVERTGWSGDGAPFGGTNGSGVTMTGRLDDFTMGAINQHFTRSLNRVPGVDFRKASEQEGSAVATFMKRLGRLNDINIDAVGFSDQGAELGRQRFISAGCNECHGNAGALNGGPPPINGNMNTQVESVRHPDLAGFPSDGGDFFFTTSNATPPQPLGNGTFNAPPVIEAADTGPFFHTDTQVIDAPAENTSSAQTIEQAVAFYNSQAFRLDTTINAADIANMGRFLRAINAIFNIQMASNRIAGARNMANVLGNVARVDRMQRRMAQMALFELDDAVRALTLCIDDETLPSKVNICSPNPASNAEISAAIAQTLHRPSWLTAPSFGLKLLFGEGAETILTGQFVVPGVLQQRATTPPIFEHPTLAGALKASLEA